MLKSIGSSSNPDEVERLYRQGQAWIRSYGGQLDLLLLLEAEQHARHEMEETARVLSNINNILINGIQLILNRVFHCVGFDKINDDKYVINISLY
ncbi:hypothetical protein EZS27_031830 [termite gut metagenome]|uniref:Uncharacterized protein n=1 Tax=termite gut metagenome TaxID=433724 RepID=A0A5J4QAT7_9ZZZZ